MKRTLFLFLIALSGVAGAQVKADIKGVVVDSAQESIPRASVSVLDKTDSTMINFAISGMDGTFRISKVKGGDYLLQIAFVGHQTYYREITIDSETTLDVGTVVLELNTLAGVEIVGEAIPVQIKGDSVEYNASSFKTQVNDNVEELLKKMPGIEVDQDGNVKAQGEDVQKVLVDGKEFFGDDPKMATKNLPADAIDKVQVYDKKSEMSEFTGIDDGQEQKTINLKLKKDKKNGIFGNVEGGAGLADREDSPILYKGKASVNKFTDKTQFSFLGMANNTNETGFSWGDFKNFMGGNTSSMGSGGGWSLNNPVNVPIGSSQNGLTDTYSGGVNLNHEFSKKVEVNTSYFYYDMRNDLQKSTFRENFLETGNYDTDERVDQYSTNQSHSVNLRLDIKLDSMSEITLVSNGAMNLSDLTSTDSTLSLSAESVILNEQNRAYRSDQLRYNLNNSLYYKKKFKKKGRNMFLEGSLNLASTDIDGDLFSTSLFNSDSMSFSDTTIQNQFQNTDDMDISVRASWTEPLGKRQYLEIEANYSDFSNDQIYEVYDMASKGSELGTLNQLLSNNYLRDYTYERGKLGYRIIRKKINFSVAGSGQWSQLKGDIVLQDTTISKEFFYFLPEMQFRWSPRQSTALRINYRTSIQEPSLQQLQPLVDNSDPLNIYIGNPDLQPEYRHTGTIRFHTFSQFSMFGMFAQLRTVYTENNIVNEKLVDELFRQTTRPINVDQNISNSLYLAGSGPLKFIKSRFNASLSGSWTHGILFVNNVENITDRYNTNGSLSISYDKSKIFDVYVGGSINYNTTAYDVSTQFNQDYFTYTGFVDLDISLREGNWLVSSSFDYSLYTGSAFTEDTEIPLLQASVSKFFAAKRGEAKFKVFDILNQNTGISQFSDLNYVETERSNTIGRYYMLSVTWKLSKFAKEEKGHGWWGGRRRR